MSKPYQRPSEDFGGGRRPNKRRKNKKFYPEVKPAEKRVTVDDLMKVLTSWDEELEECETMRLIAFGGTGMALMGHKPLEKDIEFLVPDKKEFGLLIEYLKKSRYKYDSGSWQRGDKPFVFRFSSGNKVYTTELLGSALQNSGHVKIQEMKKIYLGVLNPADIIISKLARGKDTDFQDCLTLLKKEKVNVLKLKSRFKETFLYDLRETRLMENLDRLLRIASS